MRRTHEEPGDREVDAPPPPSSDAFHRPTMQVGADVFSRSTVPGEYPALAIERAIHDVPDEVVAEHVEPSIEPVIAAPTARMTQPIAAAFSAVAPLPFAAPRIVRDARGAEADHVERATRPAIPRALPSSPTFMRTSEDVQPASISLSPITTGRSSAELSPVSAAPRRSPLVPAIAAGFALALVLVVAFVARRAPTAPEASAVITSPQSNVVAAPVAKGETPKPPVDVTSAPLAVVSPEPAGEPAIAVPTGGRAKQEPRAPRATAKVEAQKAPGAAPRSPSKPRAANRPFEVED